MAVYQIVRLNPTGSKGEQLSRKSSLQLNMTPPLHNGAPGVVMHNLGTGSELGGKLWGGWEVGRAAHYN